MSGFDDSEAFEAASAAALPLSQRAMAARGGGGDASHGDYLAGLNAAQKAGVQQLDGPVLMLAGAGTGKTTALMARVAHIFHSKRAADWQILAVTFTNKAAQDMKRRWEEMPYKLPPIKWMGTFHSISAKLLRQHAELVELKSTFTIVDSDDQLRLLKQVLDLKEVDTKRWPPRLVASFIENWKNAARLPSDIRQDEDFELDSGNFKATGERVVTTPIRYSRRPDDDRQGLPHPVVTIKEVYSLYQERLLTLNCCDFGDLLLHCIAIFRNYPEIQRKYQNQFRYIVVDEYQDTNVAQYLWLRLLVNKDKNICCVGDDDQSIYGWRGAEVDNILRFEKDFPGAHVVRLEQNYRSTQHILAAANGIIAQNKARLGKTLFTEKQGEKLRLTGYWDGEEEARSIGEAIEGAQRGRGVPRDYSLDHMAILVRASHQMRAFEDRFLTIGLPYRVIGGPRFYERAEIRDAMAYFRLVISPEDDLAFERIINLPKRGLGDVAFRKIQTLARELETSLMEGARALLAQGGIGGKGAAQLRMFVDNIYRWHWNLGASMLGQGDVVEGLIEPLTPTDDKSHIALAQTILDESGYIEMYFEPFDPKKHNEKVRQKPKDEESAGRLENLKELIKALDGFDSLQGFLEHVSLIMENDSEEATEKVTIMTLHAAKGLEFPVVFLPGWEEGLFPSQRSMDESGQKGLEEERRLAYVGITRAEELCCISFASNRRVYGQWQSQLPSRFVDELPSDHVDVQTAPSLYGGGYGAAAPSFAASFDAKVAAADGYDSPGWRRMQGNAAQRGLSQPREARHMTIDAEALSAYGLGDRVFHQKFGYGEVMATEGNKLVVEFDHAGEKHVVASWVIPAHQAENDVPF